MELSEAIEEIKEWRDAYSGPCLNTILNAAADGTLIPAEQSVKVKPLEWWLSDTGNLCADTLIGRYQLEKVGSRWCCMYAQGVKIRAEREEPSWHNSEHDAKAAAQADYEKRIRSALIPADQCYEVREGYKAWVLKHDVSDNGDTVHSKTATLTEALTIRSADDVRREALEEVSNVASENCDPWTERKIRKLIASLIDTPQPKGGDDE